MATPRVATTIGNSQVRRLAGGAPSARTSFGLATIKPGTLTLTPKEAALRVRRLRIEVRAKGTAMLLAAAQPLVDQWKENIDAEGWGPSSLGFSGTFEEGEEEQARRSGYSLGGEDFATTRSTGRYYDSIKSEVSDELVVHVGSTIPKPSGNGLNQWSYPEALEFGTSRMTEGPYPTLGPAIASAGPLMRSTMQGIFNGMCQAALMEKFSI